MPVDENSESYKAGLATPAERRRNLRFPFSAAVEAVETKSGVKVMGRTSDLGLGGCYVDTLSPFPVGAEARIRILRERETFEAQAKVVYSMIGMGMGLAFVSAHPKQVQTFQRWVLEISGQPAPPPVAAEREADRTPQTERTQLLVKNAVLSDLIMTLMQKKVLSEAEGKDLLRKLFA